MKIENKTNELQKPTVSLFSVEKKSIDKETIDRENITKEKNFPASNIVWTNNVYKFNKINQRDTLFTNNILKNFIEKFFNLSLLPKKRFTKSKRMRDLIKRSSIKKIFSAKPELKLTNDKAIINVYTYNRIKQHYVKSLYFTRHSKNYNFLYNNSTLLVNKKDKKEYIDHLYYNIRSWKIKNNNRLLENKHFITQPMTELDERLINYSGWFYYQYPEMLKAKSSDGFILDKKRLWNYKSFINYRGIIRYKHLKKHVKYLWFKKLRKYKRLQIKKLFYSLMYNKNNYFKNKQKYISLIKKRYPWEKKHLRFRIKRRLRSRKLTKFRMNNIKLNYLKKKYINNIYTFYIIKSLSTLGVKINVINKKVEILQDANCHSSNKLIIHINKFNNINNNIIINILTEILNKVLKKMFNERYANFFKKSLLKKTIKSKLYIMKENSSNIKTLSKLYINQLKFNKRLPSLKFLLEKLLNKKIQFNFIKLKYIQLNTQNLLKVINSKLSKKKGRVLRILKRSLKTAKLPLNFDLKKHNNYNDNIKKVFTDIHYKWISGITIKAKGRLTRRFTAARALFKLKRKGNLKNLEPKKLVENTWIDPSISMIRNHIKPNIDYKIISGKKRIGAFGIKGWISSN